MKKAFTLVELVIVLVVAGILMAMAIPRTQRDNIYDAANQLIAHIRYTQHLAMQDNRFNPSDAQWFKGIWQIQFVQNITAGGRCKKSIPNAWAYHIYSDRPTYTGNPDIAELARNPEDPNIYLSGGFNNTICVDSSENPGNVQTTSDMRLGETYNIQNIAFSNTCTTGGKNPSRRIGFDNTGRPLFGAIHNFTSPYGTNARNRLVLNTCAISLCTTDTCDPCTVNANNVVTCPAPANPNERVNIAIEPESGYTHFVN